jgi:hypothetical protein
LLGRKSLRLLPGIIAWSGLACAQCYNLGETHLYEPKGRFIERWKDSDFHLDQSEYGDVMQFAALAGTIRKTGSSWAPFRAARKIFYWCEAGVRKDGGYTCFMQPYFAPTAQATIRRSLKEDRESWTLSREGIFRYERHQVGGFTHYPSSGTFDVVATLDLNTKAYEVSIKVHAVGVHRHLNKDGIELWREQPFHAKAMLTEVACPVGAQKVALRLGQDRIEESEMTAPPPCVVKLKTKVGDSKAFEFIFNPRKATSAQGCVVVHEEPVKDGSGLANALER